MQKKRSAIMVVLAVVLVAALTAGGTLAYMTDSESRVNTFKVGDLDITLGEPNYNECFERDDRVPGDSFPKDPTVREVLGNSYMRVWIQFKDEGGNPITGARLEKILLTIYYDRNFSGAPDDEGYKGSSDLWVWGGDGPSGSHTPDASRHYSLADLNGKVGDNTGDIQRWYNHDDFTLEEAGPGAFFLNYNDILYEGESVQVFTSIVYPREWDQYDLQGGRRPTNAVPVVGIGNYRIQIDAQAIQAEGFRDRDEAFSHLADALNVNYKTVGG